MFWNTELLIKWKGLLINIVIEACLIITLDGHVLKCMLQIQHNLNISSNVFFDQKRNEAINLVLSSMVSAIKKYC